MSLPWRILLRLNFLATRWVGENFEKPITLKKLNRTLLQRGYSDFELTDVGGKSDLYTWAAVGIDGRQQFVIKVQPAFGIRPKWRRRKTSRLFERMNSNERMVFINDQARVMYETGSGPKPLTGVDDEISIVEWIDGGKLETSSADFNMLRSVIADVVNLSKKGIRHGDLHAGNVILSSAGESIYIDSDNKFVADIPRNTVLAIDLATLIGSIVLGRPQAERTEAATSCIAALDSVGGNTLVDHVRAVARDYASENRWLAGVAEVVVP
jgi:tRNA A-37 threonylcarbamoyl transferase component Bud32